MVGKLGLANIEPEIPYLIGATGPLAGARLLFPNNKTAKLRAIRSFFYSVIGPENPIKPNETLPPAAGIEPATP